MAALDAPTSGTVLIGDTDATALKDRELTVLRRDRVGFVFQSFNLLRPCRRRRTSSSRNASAVARPTGRGSTRWCARSASVTG
ncbi:MAG TPA: hypothetical protein VK923_02665 [Euzebyales bacterium]|nr:hypothetical protein [Euzebyales bacterium]